MEDLRQVIADNISDLRRKNGITQAELAEKLNYSDKAVSKWERAESLPDITVLKEIADLFAVRVDYLITADHSDPAAQPAPIEKRRRKNRRLIAAMSVVLVWLIATLVFVSMHLVTSQWQSVWLSFVFAVPVTAIVWLVFSCIWFEKKGNFWIISLLAWSLLVSIYLALLCFLQKNTWPLFFIGIPGQIIIFLWSGIRRSHHRE